MSASDDDDDLNFLPPREVDEVRQKSLTKKDVRVKASQANNKERTIEQTYTKMEPHEHVLTRPDMYIGSTRKVTDELWVWDTIDQRMIQKNITYSPGLYKIFDEVLVNAADNAQRDPSMTFIKVIINCLTGSICVHNDGNGIPIEMHKIHQKYVPELIFGDLLTGSNFDDQEEKVTGGRNGLGAKLANIYSHEFIVETCCKGKLFKQVFTRNMYERETPVITSTPESKDFTKITFKPDLSRFEGMTRLDDDIISLFSKRVYDVAGCNTKIKVWLNQVKIDFRSFKDYVKLYFKDSQQEGQQEAVQKNSEVKMSVESNQPVKLIGPEIVTDKTGLKRWEVVFCTSQGDFQQISFVNSIWTIRGGTHVQALVKHITDAIQPKLKKKNKGVDVKPAMIRNQMFIFVNALINNPEFDSQTKELLKSNQSSWGTKPELSEKFLTSITNQSGLIDKILLWNQARSAQVLKSTSGSKTKRRLGISKLTEANDAAGKNSSQCTLIVTEGDSAKGLALAGLSVVGRDRYGIFPLRGKVLNVRDVKIDKVMDNEELNSIKEIMGLQHDKQYKDVSSLRYGRIMIMTDQDSVMGHTPVLVRDENKQVQILRIDELFKVETDGPSGRQYGYVPFEAWTERGWTRIRHVMRHRVNKRIFRVHTHTGVVDVTEDHSLIKNDLQPTTPLDIKVGDELLHSFPIFSILDNIPDDLESCNLVKQLHPIASKLGIQYWQIFKKEELVDKIRELLNAQQVHLFHFNEVSEISEEEAYVMGLFWAKGHCKVHKLSVIKKPIDQPHPYKFNHTAYEWRISNTNLDYLRKAKDIMSRVTNFTFIIDSEKDERPENHKTMHHLQLRGGSQTRSLIDKYRALFYDEHGNMRVPPEILNAPQPIRQQFFQGYCDGDRFKTSKRDIEFDCEGAASTQGLFWLCKSLGFQVSINTNPLRQSIYTCTITKDKQQDNPDRVKKIIDLGVCNCYVYDLETENHHFQAGVGQMIVHNTDGSHIKGLFINFIHHFWPSLSRIPGFLCEFITPIVKVSKGDKTIAFYTLPQYQAWRESNNTRGWLIKYYKGLGTSEPAEMQEYFADLPRHKKDFIYTGIKDDEAINLAFLKTNANRRKEWLSACKPGTHLDDALVEIPYHRFVNEELILFSREDCERSIPSLMDGFKPGQRKIMYACFKRDLKGEIKIAQLAGYVLENCAYHHGEVSLYSTMIGMAQNFVGANNLNLLEPVGNFGSRDQGGKDAAAARYIFTSLSPLTRYIFHPDDDQVLEYCEDEGMKIEPKWYAPCIPMSLVNSNKGIGTGWSSFVPNYNPRDLVANTRRLLNGETELKPMHPWYLGFQGKIEWMENKNRYKVSGVWRRVEGQEDVIEITELPIGEWTQDYKDDLELTIKKTDEAEKKAKLEAKKSKLENDGDSDDNDSKPKIKKTKTKKNAPKEDDADDDVAATAEKDYGVKKGRKNGFGVAIKDFKEYHTTTRVHFVVTSAEFAKMTDEQIEKALDLTTSISLSNMHLFDAEGRIKKYPSPEEILKEYFIIRFQIYEKRKRALEEAIAQQLKILSNKMRFIKEVIEKTLIVTNRKKDDLFAELKKKSYDTQKAIKPKSSDEEEKDDTQNEESKNETNRDYDYLLSMAIWSLTAERYANLADQVAKKQAELDQMRAVQAADLWERDLDVFLDAWDRFEANMKILDECGVGGSAFRKPSSTIKPSSDAKKDNKKVSATAAHQAALKKLQVLRPINQNNQSVPTPKLGREKFVMPTVRTDPIVPPPKLTKKEREQLVKRSLPEVDEDESLDFIEALPAPKRVELNADDDDDDIFLPS